ncbi:PKD domain-containing protein [Candidatus Sulfidibacterium hydrothermale]|uniref:PKD domain-containing protein n=1 Tax=Candidatus Sulfidibacterium hydrothermale TaxID=2875962 RepID=UPI001F0A6CC9|nr:PKD domain-containing protein [Candidatus Sulfidibacterium hydrothermale]UBM62490.1 PKD domain-containing protein [Candidatus Sulfidibacterium hydrothermale]
MKKKFTLFVLSRMSVFILVVLTGFSLFAQTQKSRNNTITSTSSGGSWSDTLTWVGYVVPTENDDVVIKGKVVIDYAAKCHSLTVENGDTLTKDGYSRTFYVTGDFTNNGVVTENTYGYFTISIGGDVMNNGRWESSQILFAGVNNDTLSMGSTAEFNNMTFWKSDTNSYLVIGSDFQCNNSIFDGLNSDGGFYKLKLASGTGYQMDLKKTSILSNVYFDGSGGELKDAFIQTFSSRKVYMENVRLKGKTIIASSDVHFINGNVVVEDTLTKDDYTRTLFVVGDFTNNGIVTENTYGDFVISISGNAMNNGKWESGQILFTGVNDNTLSMSSTAEFNNIVFRKSDTNSYLVIGSDFQCSNSNFYGVNSDGGFYKLKLASGTGYQMDLKKTSILSNIYFDGSGGELKDAFIQTFSSRKVYMENVKLKGKTIIASSDVYFINGNVVVEDTLTKDDYTRTLFVVGDFTNNGIVTENTYGDFVISISGNAMNNGKWESGQILFTGVSNDTLSMSSTAEFNNIVFRKSDTNSYLVIGSDFQCSNSNFYGVNSDGGFYKLKLASGTGYQMDLKKTSILSNIYFDGSGGELKDAFIQTFSSRKVYMENVRLKGKTIIASSDVHFINGNVVVEDTLTKDDYTRTLFVVGDFTNNGIVTENTYGDFVISISGNAMNNGKWESGQILFTGVSNDTLSMSSTAEFNNIVFRKSDTNSYLVIGSDFQCSNSNFYGVNSDGGFYKLKLASGTGYQMDLKKTSILNNIYFDGSGGELKDAFIQTFYSREVYMENVKLKGKTIIASSNIHFINGNVVVEDTLTKDDYYRTLYVTGDFTNNGVIAENTYGDLTISVSGNVVNNGIWNIGWTIMDGTGDQIFSNMDSLYTGFLLQANVASATTYQWYKDDTAISGATDSTYTISATTEIEDIYSAYYCQTDQGNSRKITLQKEEITTLSADFSSDVTSGTAPLQVQFTDKSTGNPTSWNWNFGDGSTSAEQNPSHIYNAAGDYTVTLTVSDGTNNNTETKSDYIKVSTTGINDPEATTDRLLMQNYPNPFHAQTHIFFNLEQKSDVKLIIFNSLGQKIAVPVSEEMDAGKHEVLFDGSSLHPGIYYYRLIFDGKSTTKRMVIVK